MANQPVKTNVLRFLDSRRVPYEARTYCEEGFQTHRVRDEHHTSRMMAPGILDQKRTDGDGYRSTPDNHRLHQVPDPSLDPSFEPELIVIVVVKGNHKWSAGKSCGQHSRKRKMRYTIRTHQVRAKG